MKTMNNLIIALVVTLCTGCAPPAAPIITKTEFEQLKTGMTLDQAKKIIGAEGTELSKPEIPGTPSTVMQSWQNADGTNANAMFQKGKLITKAQLGLK